MTSRGSASLTSRGWALLAAAAALAISAFLFGLEELYAIACSALVLLVGSRAWIGTRQVNVRVVRHVRPGRVPAGATARVELTVVNQGSRSSPVLAASDPFDGGRRWARFLIAPLEPGEVRMAAYSLPTSKRGSFQLGPLQLEMSDPFGLAHVTAIGCGQSVLTVHPRVEPVRARHLPAEPEPDTRVPLPVVGRLGDEFYGLREYQIGDDLRRVHWASTARLDELMIRQPENLLQGRLTVGVDLRAAVHDQATLEAALSAAASLVMASLRTRIHVRLMTTAGGDIGFGTTGIHGAMALDLLAEAEAHRGMSLFDHLRLGPSPGPLVIITTQSASATDLAAASRAGVRDSTTVVAFERAGGAGVASGLDLRPSRCRFVLVPGGGSFRAAWEGAAC